jgi:hypothetical protein
MLRPVIRIIVVASLLAALALVAQARPRIRRDFVAAYPRTQGTRLDACVTCHEPPTSQLPNALNPYGTALRKALFNFAGIEKQDSDGDGFTNRKEIDLLSFPGDSTDRPGARRDSAAADSTARRDSTVARPDTSAARPDTLRRR